MNNNANLLIKKYENQIYKIAHKYSKYYPLEDLFQAGALGLIKSQKNYKESINENFISYAYKYIHGEIISFIKTDRIIKVNDEYIKIYKTYEKVKCILTNNYGRDPTFNEIASFMEILPEELLHIIESTLFSKSLDNNEYDLQNNYFIDERENIENKILIDSEIEKLDDFEKSLIDYRYFQGFNQEETADLLGISQAKVSRQEKQILLKMSRKISA